MTDVSILASAFNESVIRRTSVACARHGAINLGQGFPDEAMPCELKDAAIAAVREDHNQYSDTWGAPRLRDAVASKMCTLYGADVTGAEHVTITCGSTEAMMAALLAVVEPEEEVILLEPVYENYKAQCLMARAVPKFVPLSQPDFALDYERLAAAFSSRTAAIIVNNPNNPCGKVFTEQELRFIASLCQQHGVTAISDEVYEHLIYDGHRHVPLTAVPEFGDRRIVISSCSKTYHATGWRVGYAIAPARLTNAIRRCHDFMSCAAPTPFQHALAPALQMTAAAYETLARHYDAKRHLLVDILNEVGLPCRAPEGAYYVLADTSGLGYDDSVVCAERLLMEGGVAAVPWPSFYSEAARGRRWLRFTFSKSAQTIQLAGERLHDFAKNQISDRAKSAS